MPPSPPLSPCLELQNVSRRFGRATVLDQINIRIPAGSFTALLGASGCGKSTTLRLMAGLDRPDAGQIILNGQEVSDRTASERNVAMVFQSYALYPHLSVFQNIALPLTMRHLGKLGRIPGLGRLIPGQAQARADIRTKVHTTAESLGLGPVLHQKPGTLSGGQQQRVALGRALVRDPVLFLLDEPLSNLDARLRLKMRAELVALHQRTSCPFVYVTHDQAEAMAMANQIIVMVAGRVAQAGHPRELYERPAHTDVAAFIGTNTMNFFEPDDPIGALSNKRAGCIIGIRPEHLHPVPNGDFCGHFETAEFLGPETVLGLRLPNGKQVTATAPGDFPLPATGHTIRLGADHLHYFDSHSGYRCTGAR